MAPLFPWSFSRLGSCLLCAVVFPSVSAMAGAAAESATPAAADFVRVEQGAFVLRGKPYRFVGVNYWYAPWLGRAGVAGDRARLGRELDQLAQLGLTNLRLVALTEACEATPLRAAAQTAPGVFDEAWLDGLDYAVAEMAKRDMKLVLSLTNYWTWSGGLTQYVAWANDRPLVPDTGPWHDFNRSAASFYSDAKAQELFRRAVERLVMRTNRYTGRLYRDEPAIQSWQLCNEPRPGSWEQRELFAKPLAEWVERAAGDLKKLGVRQLVSVGSEGLWGCNGDAALLRAIHAPANVDYVTAHLWPQNWSWYDPKRAAETFPVTEQKVGEYFDQHEALARALGKPLVFEEFGLPRDGAGCTPESGTTDRDRFLAIVVGRLRHSAANGGPLQGLNYWTWSGEAVPEVAKAGKPWTEGDTYRGDNPMEPQGLYSVFPSDTSTIRQLREAAEAVRSLP